MEIIIYRHAKPTVSQDEIISGQDFPLWVERYNASGIGRAASAAEKEEVVFTSDLLRSYETGILVGNRVMPDPLFREAEIPLLRFPPIRFKAEVWLFFARMLWLSGLTKGCESLAQAKERAKAIVARIKSSSLENGRCVVVGHGFINHLVKKELLRQGWVMARSEKSAGFLSRRTFLAKPEANLERAE